MNEKHCTDLLVGYALEILDGEDRLTAEEHLTLCSECREEMETLRETLHVCMGHAVQAAQPDPLVKTRFLAQFAVELEPPAPAPPLPAQVPREEVPEPSALPAPTVAAAPRASSARQRVLWLFGGGALPAVAAVIFCVLFLRTQNQLNDQKSNALAEALSSPHTTMHLTGVALHSGMSGEVLMQHQSGTGVLIISGIHRVPSGMTYTSWVRKNGHWMNGGVLQPDASGMAMVSFMGTTSLKGADTVAVTMEHSRTSTTPSKPMLLMSSI